MRPPVIKPKNEPKKTKIVETAKKPVKRATKKKAGKYEDSELAANIRHYAARRDLIIDNEQGQ